MEDRIKKLEMMVGRLARRATKKTTAIITPYPISSCVVGDDVRGEVLRYMFCCPGTVNKGMVFLDKKPKKDVNVVVSLETESGGVVRSPIMSDKLFVVELDMDILPGDRLTVSIYPTGADKLSEVWLAFMWTPNIADAHIKHFLIDEIEKDVLERE